MSIDNPKEFAHYTKRFVISFLQNLDKQLMTIGPHEALEEFLYSYGYSSSASIMDQIVPTGVFDKKELKMLEELEKYIVDLILQNKNTMPWSFLSKSEYLNLKSISYDFLIYMVEKRDYPA